MTAASLLICWSLLGQARTNDSDFPTPALIPRGSSPAARLDDGRPPRATTTTPNLYGDSASDSHGSSSRRSSSFESDPRDRGTDPRFDRETTEPDRRAPVGKVNQKLRPPELISEALSEVPEGAFQPIEGEQSRYQKLRLVDALKRSNDRAQQIRIAQAYWRLAIAQADYHYARDAVAQLRGATVGQLNQPALRAARCAMRALQRDAEALVIRGQIRLASEMKLAPTALIPLTIDIPLTSSYNDYYDQVRNPPTQVQVIHLTLPIRRQQIEEHAEGILAALDAVDTSVDEYSRNTSDLTTIILAFERLWKERKAFTDAVRGYNQDIAEYALTVAPPNSDATALVAMLIAPANSRSTSEPSPPLNTPRTARPLDEESPSLRNTTPSTDRYRGSLNAPVNPIDEKSSPQIANSTNRAVLAHTVNYQEPIRRNVDFDEAYSQHAMWRALVDVDTPLRTQRLVTNLHAEELLPRDGGKRVSLGECLKNCPPQTRRDVISAYWYAKEAVTAHQVLLDEVNALDSLFQPASRVANVAGGEGAGVRLQSLRRSVRAAILDAQVEMIVAQSELTELCGGHVQDELFLPDTAPHGGRYQLRLEEQPQQLVESKGLEQLGALIKVLHFQMVDHAGTVVYADTARATALGQLGGGPVALNAAMAFVERQTSHTIFFLRATTKYNIAIADYVLSIMPENASADELVSALVLTRSRMART